MQIMPLSPKAFDCLQLRHLGFSTLFLLIGAVATAFMPKLLGGKSSCLQCDRKDRGQSPGFDTTEFHDGDGLCCGVNGGRGVAYEVVADELVGWKLAG